MPNCIGAANKLRYIHTYVYVYIYIYIYSCERPSAVSNCERSSAVSNCERSSAELKRVFVQNCERSSAVSNCERSSAVSVQASGLSVIEHIYMCERSTANFLHIAEHMCIHV